MIRFLFGRPGTGKTTRIVREIQALCADGSCPVYLIVPEQQAYSAERDVLSALPPEAGRCLSVLSFSRLCDKVADLYGGRAQHTVTRAMKSLLMWEPFSNAVGNSLKSEGLDIKTKSIFTRHCCIAKTVFIKKLTVSKCRHYKTFILFGF